MLPQRADELRAKARKHKRAIRHHRAELRRVMEELRAVCEAHGIKLEKA